MYSPLMLANNFINKAQDEKIPLTPMKLQKLLFLLYGYHLSNYSENLITEKFVAWKYGPVLITVFHEFKSFGSNNITSFYEDTDNQIYIINEDGNFSNSINYIWSKYKRKHGYELSNLTHRDNTAWSKSGNFGLLLRDEDIIEDFENERYT